MYHFILDVTASSSPIQKLTASGGPPVTSLHHITVMHTEVHATYGIHAYILTCSYIHTQTHRHAQTITHTDTDTHTTHTHTLSHTTQGERNKGNCNSYQILEWPMVGPLQRHYAVLKTLVQSLSSASECNRHPCGAFLFCQQGHPGSGASSFCALKVSQSSRSQLHRHIHLE